MAGEASVAFNAVRPYCVEFIQKQNVESVKKLHEKLLNLTKDSLDEISQYVLFPFRVLLKKNGKKDDAVLTEACHCLAYILQCCTINDWALINELLTLLCAAITDPTDKSFTACGSEELRKSVVTTIAALLGHSCYPVWQELYRASSIPMLGHIVSLALSVIKSKITRDARVEACKALKALSKPDYLRLLEESQQVVAASKIGDCMACFLPGISSCLAKVISSDTNAGHNVKSQCLDLLSTILTTTLGDTTVSTSDDIKSKSNTKDANPKLASLIVTRDEKWVAVVAEKLVPVILNVTAASDSDSWSLRYSCVDFCGNILLQCSGTLKSCSNVLLKVPVKLLNDDYARIRDRSSEILEEFSSKLQDGGGASRMLVEILEENLFILCTDLPRMMRRDMDKNKLSTLKIMLGYLTLLKQRISGLLYSAPHMKKLTATLVHCLELDTASIHIVEQTAPVEGGSGITLNDPRMFEWNFRKQFVHFRDDRIFDVLKSICHVLGQYGDLELLIDHFLEMYMTSETNCRQAVIILGEVLTGAGQVEANKVTMIKSILDEILSPENWYLVTSYDSDYFRNFHHKRAQKTGATSLMPASTRSVVHEDLTLKNLKNNVLLVCLHLEVVLTFSKVLRKDFKPFLMDALYPVLEKTMENDVTISECALNVVHGVAINCGYKSSQALIADNADYLISTISIQLHHLNMFPRCPAVLQAMLDHSNMDMLVIVSDTVDEILTALDIHHLNTSKLLIFLPVLYAVVKAVKRWQPGSVNLKTDSQSCAHSELSCGRDETEKISDEEDDDVIKAKKFAEDLKNSLLEIRKNQQIADLEQEPEVDPDWEPGDEDAAQEEQDVPEEKEQVPLEIEVTSKVLSRCIHLMAHSDPRVRLKVMDIIAVGVDVLKAKQNELLPMAHKIWAPLVVRFADKELQVVARAFDTLCVMAAHSKDFLRKRFCKEILPKLLYVLETQSKQSRTLSLTRSTMSAVRMAVSKPYHALDSNTVAYTHLTAFKLQRKVLTELGPLLKDIEIARKEQISVCKSCMPYLSGRQPRQLQEAATILFKSLIEIDADLTWLELTWVWCPEPELHPPKEWKDHPTGAKMKTVYLGGSNDCNNEFASNIKKLLSLC